MVQKGRDLKKSVKRARKPSAFQVLELLEFEFLDEWGRKDFCLVGDRMSEASMYADIGLGYCPNPHHDWRGHFWKVYRVMRKKKKDMGWTLIREKKWRLSNV